MDNIVHAWENIEQTEAELELTEMHNLSLSMVDVGVLAHSADPMAKAMEVMETMGGGSLRKISHQGLCTR